MIIISLITFYRISLESACNKYMFVLTYDMIHTAIYSNILLAKAMVSPGMLLAHILT